MIDHYINIYICWDLSDSFVMSALFNKLHFALVKLRQENIGISFPNAKMTLGNLMRIHGSQQALQQLMDTVWYQPILDYINIGAIETIPENTKHCIVKRIQVKSSAERLLRRSERKGWISKEDIPKKLAEIENKQLSLPYVKLKSSSTGQPFRLFIKQTVEAMPCSGSFSCYGLSSSTTVPWF